jgi:hypothetical protein
MMSPVWQQVTVWGALVGAGLYLLFRFLRNRRRPKCHDCALGQLAGKPRLPRL